MSVTLSACVAEFSLHENPSSACLLEHLQKGTSVIYVYLQSAAVCYVSHHISLASSNISSVFTAQCSFISSLADRERIANAQLNSE